MSSNFSTAMWGSDNWQIISDLEIYSQIIRWVWRFWHQSLKIFCLPCLKAAKDVHHLSRKESTGSCNQMWYRLNQRTFPGWQQRDMWALKHSQTRLKREVHTQGLGSAIAQPSSLVKEKAEVPGHSCATFQTDGSGMPRRDHTQGGNKTHGLLMGPSLWKCVQNSY